MPRAEDLKKHGESVATARSSVMLGPLVRGRAGGRWGCSVEGLNLQFIIPWGCQFLQESDPLPGKSTYRGHFRDPRQGP